MTRKHQLEFYVLRYVPDAVKNEFVNFGVVMVGAQGDGTFAEARLTKDWRRVRCLDPQADVEMLEALGREVGVRICEEGREVWMQKLQDSLSNVVQITPAHACLAEDPAREIEQLASLYLEAARGPVTREVSARQRIVGAMREAFEQAGVWDLMRKQIAIEKYTHKGDPLKIDCGYKNGGVKLFHATALRTDMDAAKVLAFGWPKIAAGIQRDENVPAYLTAVVEESLERTDEIEFGMATLSEAGIQIAAVSEMAGIAERARAEMRAR